MNTFKVTIAGSRTLMVTETNYPYLCSLMDRFITENLPEEYTQIEIVSGNANGADKFGERYARDRGYKLTIMKAEWDVFDEGDPVKLNKYGKKYNPIAGHKRNKKMGDYSDMLIALWDKKSTGTKQMLTYMKSLGKIYKLITF